MPLLLEHCQFQMIEEIIRPAFVHNESEFCVILKKKMYPDLTSRIKGGNSFSLLQFHPLIDENSRFRYIFYSMMKNSEPKLRKSLAYTNKK